MVVALGGFLFWNFNPAKMFMGNCGSLAIGGLVTAAYQRVYNRAPNRGELADGIEFLAEQSLLDYRTEHQSSNTTKPIDSNTDCHRICSLLED